MFDVYINNFNRCESLRRLLRWLSHAEGVGNICILDNGSSYVPTLELYNEISGNVEIIHLEQNAGSHALNLVMNRVPPGRFIYSDADLEPDNCPLDLLYRLSEMIDRYELVKAGPCLSMDIPECYPFCFQVKEWETRFWKNQTKCGGGFHADIDTTFAMYQDKKDFGKYGKAVRLAPPYAFRHVDWYESFQCPSREYLHYVGCCSPSSSYGTKAKSFFDGLLYREIDDFCDRLVGRSFYLQNLTHASETLLTFGHRTCEAWNLDGNIYRCLADRHAWIAYAGGNFSIDLVQFDESYQFFSGRSDRDWKICGQRA